MAESTSCGGFSGASENVATPELNPRNRHKCGISDHPCGISDHDLIYTIRHAKLPKIKQEPRILTIRIHKNITESSLLYDLNGIPFDLISDTSDNAVDLWMTWKTFFMNILNKYAPIKTSVKGNNLMLLLRLNH